MTRPTEPAEPKHDLPPELVESLSDLLAAILVNDYREKHDLTPSAETQTPKRGEP